MRGVFEVLPGTPPREMQVTFDEARLKLGGATEEARALRKPASVVLKVLLMTPTWTVTRSSVGSLALLERVADADSA